MILVLETGILNFITFQSIYFDIIPTKKLFMNKNILALAIPNIISNISVPLVSAADTILMGHLSSAHLAALGVVSMVFMFLYGTMNFLRMGTTGITAQAYGKKDNRAISQTLY